MFSSPKLKFALLNVLRFISLISLLFVLIANFIMVAEDVKAIKTPIDKDHEDCDYLENSGVPHQALGEFRAFLSLAVNILQCVIFILAETDFRFETWGNKLIPVLGEDRLVAIGVLEILLAVQMMSHFLEPFPLVASFFLLVAGVLNTLTFYVSYPRSSRAWGMWKEHNAAMAPSSRFASYSQTDAEKGFARQGSQQSHGISSPARAIVGRSISRTPPQYSSSIHSDPFTSDEKVFGRYA